MKMQHKFSHPEVRVYQFVIRPSITNEHILFVFSFVPVLWTIFSSSREIMLPILWFKKWYLGNILEGTAKGKGRILFLSLGKCVPWDLCVSPITWILLGDLML